ncbi:hypothetical protein [Agreia sp. COWG]|uniref:hypothetical protein n=1 Tax=Agreia sp. COWG TaxID=2773266 RepID=UPI0019261A7F|nr:hypothetical protein [Agreia sp. COWG]CAD6003477.1 protein of unknown function [Agreia sp. COWG]
MTDLIRRTVEDEALTAKVVTLDRPAARKFQRSILGDVGTYFAETTERFRAAVATPVDLLIVSTHGAWSGAKVGFGRYSDDWVEIASLSGQCSTLLIVACNQEPDRAAIWRDRFSASQVVLATGEVPGQTSDREVGRVTRRPETWKDGHAVLEALLDTTRPAPAMAGAGWYVYPGSGAV